MIYSLAGDIILVCHVLYVLFVVGGQGLVVLGAALGWKFIRNVQFRALHLAAIVLVAVQSMLGYTCPLTTLESYFRHQANQSAYEKTFIAHWLTKILFYEGPSWAFTLCYTLFALAVLLSWFMIPPRFSKKCK